MMNGEAEAVAVLLGLGKKYGFWDASETLTTNGVHVCRTSSRFCLGVEHGDYNGTELFGVGTDRFIWMAFKPNTSGRIRLVSHNFPSEGVVEFAAGSTTELMSAEEREASSWKQFPLGVDFVLTKNGFSLAAGFDATIYGNIPGEWTDTTKLCFAYRCIV